jgi:uracil-DNA glycosylase
VTQDRLVRLLADIRACRCCVDAPEGAPLAHEPRPVLRASSGARLAICGQAPGSRVHSSGVPFSDASGDRLREWMAVSAEEFYDESRVAIVPMGFCFPGLDASGADLPPRRECAPRWRTRVFAELHRVELILLVGGYAQRWHLGALANGGVTETVRAWRDFGDSEQRPRHLPLPHPSWRNNAWIRANPWFRSELLPELRAEVRRILDADNRPT